MNNTKQNKDKTDNITDKQAIHYFIVSFSLLSYLFNTYLLIFIYITQLLI